MPARCASCRRTWCCCALRYRRPAGLRACWRRAHRPWHSGGAIRLRLGAARPRRLVDELAAAGRQARHGHGKGGVGKTTVADGGGAGTGGRSPPCLSTTDPAATSPDAGRRRAGPRSTTSTQGRNHRPYIDKIMATKGPSALDEGQCAAVPCPKGRGLPPSRPDRGQGPQPSSSSTARPGTHALLMDATGAYHPADDPRPAASAARRRDAADAATGIRPPRRG